MKRLSTIIGSIALVVLVVCLFYPLHNAWDGGATVQCEVQVVDSWNGNGVEHARIRIVLDSDLDTLYATNSGVSFPQVLTDVNGEASIQVFCGAGGSRTLIAHRTGSIVISHQLFVEADGYVPVSVALADLVGGTNWRLSKKEFRVKLALFKINRDG